MDEYEDGGYATEQEADNEEARWIGSQNPDRAWICTNRDVWHSNPFYRGPPVPHPESDPHEDYVEKDENKS